MSACDMCGAEGFLLNALVEGSNLKVCKNCSKYGKVLGRVRTDRPKINKKVDFQKIVKPEITETIVKDYSTIIRQAREKSNQTQEEFAQKITEKQSLVQSMEQGKFRPSLKMAKKLEKILNIKLIEVLEGTKSYQGVKSKGEVTIGDFIKVRKRK